MLDARYSMSERSVDPAAQRNGLVFYPLLFKFRPLLHRTPYGDSGISFIILSYLCSCCLRALQSQISLHAWS